jgi:AcrR family transcriptional regulator
MQPRRKQPAATRAALLDAAGDAFSRLGYHATGTGPLATAAGLTKGALFHHFPDKPTLAAAWIAERLAPAIEAEWVIPLNDGRSPGDLRTLCQRRLAVPDPASPSTTLTALSAEISDSVPQPATALQEILTAWRQATADLLRRGKDAGLVHPSVDPPAESALIVSLVCGLSVAATTPDLRRGALSALGAYFDTLNAPGS